MFAGIIPTDYSCPKAVDKRDLFRTPVQFRIFELPAMFNCFCNDSNDNKIINGIDIRFYSFTRTNTIAKCLYIFSEPELPRIDISRNHGPDQPFYDEQKYI